jgi:6,7-dimethyl-8-ribityllumazine synthase
MNTNTFREINFPESQEVAIVTSRFNEKVTGGLLRGAVMALLEAQGVAEKIPEAVEDTIRQNWEKGESTRRIKIIWVPGSVEIPMAAKKLAKSGKYAGVTTLGSVIRGDTPHFEYVCQMVSNGVLQLNLQYEIPITFGVITTENQEQAEKRSARGQGNKGQEAALAMLEMVEVLPQV